MAIQIPIIDIHHHAIFQNHRANLKLPKWSREPDQEAMEGWAFVLPYFLYLFLAL